VPRWSVHRSGIGQKKMGGRDALRRRNSHFCILFLALTKKYGVWRDATRRLFIPRHFLKIIASGRMIKRERGLHLILLIYSLLSIITFTVYAFDKLAARRGGERISERTLHLLALCGGWPGALAGQWLFRHKRRNRTFQVNFWLTVLMNVALLMGWHLWP
jgi:uncharacterized membrane protein YsdA (DUF1294 family)